MLCDNCFKEVNKEKITKYKNQYLCEQCLVEKLGGYQRNKENVFKSFIINLKDKLINRSFINK